MLILFYSKPHVTATMKVVIGQLVTMGTVPKVLK
jgi:hypothetical protein